VYFPILDADGDFVTGATGLDSEASLDGAAFADCTNEATEIGSSGVYYLDLTAAEMNADCTVVQVKTTSSGAKTTPLIFYPQESGDIKVDIQSAAGTAWGSGAITSGSISAAAANAIADALLVRNVSNVEASAGEHTLCTIILAMLENSISGTSLTIYRTNGSTTHVTKTLTTNSSAIPITGIA
jgi:hypothetical protein